MEVKLMDNPLTVFARIIAFFCALALIIALPICILAYDVGRVIFDQPLVKSVLTEIVTESDLIPSALEWYSLTRAEDRYQTGEAEAWVGEPDVVQLIEFMDAAAWRTIRWEVLPDEILVEWVSVTVDGTYAWIDADDRVPQITWDMAPLASRVASEHGVNAITTAYDALPPCTESQITDFKDRLSAAPEGTQVLYNLCEFPDPWHADQFNDYIESLEDLVANVPAQFELTGELARIEDTQGVGPEALKSQLRLSRFLMTWAPLIPIALLLLILVFAIRSLKGLGRWWGFPLTLSSLITLIFALAYQFAITGLLSWGPLSEVPSLVRQEATGGTLRLAAEIFKPMLWQTLVILAIGLVLVIVGALAKE
jgi:hypothetical protein